MFKYMWKENTNLFFLQMVDVVHCWICTDASKITLEISFPHSAEKHFLWFPLIFYQFVICGPEVFCVICYLYKTKGNNLCSKAMINLRRKLICLSYVGTREDNKVFMFFHWLLQIKSKLKHSLCWMLMKEFSVLLITVNRWEHKHIAMWAVAVLESGDCRIHCHSWAALVRLARVAEGEALADSLIWGSFFSSQPMPFCLYQAYYKLLKYCWVS